MAVQPAVLSARSLMGKLQAYELECSEVATGALAGLAGLTLLAADAGAHFQALQRPRARRASAR